MCHIISKSDNRFSFLGKSLKCSGLNDDCPNCQKMRKKWINGIDRFVDEIKRKGYEEEINGLFFMPSEIHIYMKDLTIPEKPWQQDGFSYNQFVGRYNQRRKDIYFTNRFFAEFVYSQIHRTVEDFLKYITRQIIREFHFQNAKTSGKCSKEKLDECFLNVKRTGILDTNGIFLGESGFRIDLRADFGPYKLIFPKIGN